MALLTWVFPNDGCGSHRLGLNVARARRGSPPAQRGEFLFRGCDWPARHGISNTRRWSKTSRTGQRFNVGRCEGQQLKPLTGLEGLLGEVGWAPLCVSKRLFPVGPSFPPPMRACFFLVLLPFWCAKISVLAIVNQPFLSPENQKTCTFLY